VEGISLSGVQIKRSRTGKVYCLERSRKLARTEVYRGAEEFVLQLESTMQDILIESSHVVSVDPDVAHHDVGFQPALVLQWLCIGPDMVREVGGTIGEVVGI
jgi:hypothetical protein